MTRSTATVVPRNGLCRALPPRRRCHDNTHALRGGHTWISSNCFIVHGRFSPWRPFERHRSHVARPPRSAKILLPPEDARNRISSSCQPPIHSRPRRQSTSAPSVVRRSVAIMACDQNCRHPGGPRTALLVENAPSRTLRALEPPVRCRIHWNPDLNAPLWQTRA